MDDIEGFEREMEAQRQRARAAHTFTGAMEMLPTYENLGTGKVEFVGYESLARDSVVAALLVEDQSVGRATRGQRVEIVLRETSFYAEGGGQVGDAGTITGPNGRVWSRIPRPPWRVSWSTEVSWRRETYPWGTRWRPRSTPSAVWIPPGTTAAPTCSTQPYARCWGFTCARQAPW